jgi:hypothetical protein
VITSVASPVNGYIVARAPKGTVRATYFSQGNAAAIDALMGVGSAHWPDLLEAKAFNDEYPIYISAPPGASEAYPSYLGGFYVTKRGLYKFYNITDKLELQDNSGNAYKIKVVPGKEYEFDGRFTGARQTSFTITDPNFSEPEVTKVDATTGITFKFIQDSASALILTKDQSLNVTELDYDIVENGLVSPVGTTKEYWDSGNEGLWEFNRNVATLKNWGFMGSTNPLKDFIGEEAYNIIFTDDGAGNLLTNYAILFDLLLNGSASVGSGSSIVVGKMEDGVKIAFGLPQIISFLISIKDDVYAYFMQKSCTEIPTSIKISNIGYDKYRYDSLFAYAPINKALSTKTTFYIDTDGLSAPQLDALQAEQIYHDYVVFYDDEDPTNPDKPVVIKGIGELIVPESSSDPYTYANVTSEFVTKYISCQKALTTVDNQKVFHKIFYVSDADKIKHVLTEEENIALYGAIDGPTAYLKAVATQDSAPKNPLFNSITLSCAEEVYIGKNTSGGEFVGSLDENGRDTYGSKIYFPEILTDDDVSFIEVRVLKKFGDDVGDLDENGFWKHARVVDPFDIDEDGSTLTEKNFTIEGDRFASLVVEYNKQQQKTGGIWDDMWYQIILDGLLEGMLPEYDDVYIYMEPTGQEVFKSQLAALSKANELAAVISPKILTPNNRGVFTDTAAQKVIVNGRCSLTSNAQYAGEFEYYDPITYKKYWCQPIGDVGCNLARIMEKKYGGWAPAWYNISGDLGGQLKRVVIRSKYQFEDEATHTLDTKGINPIVFTTDDGLMIVSQRTTQDPNNMSDWSYLGHSMSFQLIKREIRDNVMRPQIMKPINEYWMGLRQTQVEGILAKRTGGSSPIWSYGVCDILGQNTPMTKAQRNFIIAVNVRVNVFSELVTLVLTNESQ